MNTDNSLNKLKKEAELALKAALARVPALDERNFKVQARCNLNRNVDFELQLIYEDKTYVITVEVKSSAQPRQIRASILDLLTVGRNPNQTIVPMLIAPYLSPEARAICAEHKVSYLDMEGNCRISFDAVFIERNVSTKPILQRREFKSLFTPKSSRVLGAMMADPFQSWKVHDLAKNSKISIGHVSNVRKALLDREWATIDKGGFFISQPDALLDAWRDVCKTLPGQAIKLYSTLHGTELEKAIRVMFSETSLKKGTVLLSSFSAAKWLYPYARISNEYFYSDSKGLDLLTEHLKLSPTSKGENILVTVLDEENFPINIKNPATNIWCTDEIQTYLDLWLSGERGREAAEQLRKNLLKWKK